VLFLIILVVNLDNLLFSDNRRRILQDKYLIELIVRIVRDEYKRFVTGIIYLIWERVSIIYLIEKENFHKL